MTTIVEAPQQLTVPGPPSDSATSGGSTGAGLSPGELLARAAGRHAGAERITVEVPRHLPAAFPLFTQRPRYAVRHLLRVIEDASGPIPYVSEAPAAAPESADAPRSGTRYGTTPEAAVVPELRHAALTDLSLEVPVPEGLREAPAEVFAAFVDMRVLVRTSVVENQTLLHGSADGVITGLLRHPLARRLEAADDLADTVLGTCSEVEETGGSCDGLVVHPRTYWSMVGSGLLDKLTALNMKVSRTRMCPRDEILFGDFSAAAQLHLANRSELTLATESGRAVIQATFGVGLTVPLPRHLVLVKHDGGGWQA